MTERYDRKKHQQEFTDMGKIPPQATELEKAVLGALMIESKAIQQVAAILSPDMFYVDAHQRICRAIMELFSTRRPIDIETVADQLKKHGNLDAAGGPFFLAQLTNFVGSAANIEYHTRVVQEYYMLRELITAGNEQIMEAYNDSADPFNLVSKSLTRIMGIQQIGINGRTETTSDILDKAVLRLNSGISATPSSHEDINKNLFGWKRGNMVVVAARTGMGKTAFHISEFVKLCLAGHKCMSFNLEMLEEQFVIRAACHISGVPNTKVRLKVMDKHEEYEFYQAIEVMRQCPNMHLDFTSSLTVSLFRAKVKKMKMEQGLDVVFLDHLQFMKPEDTQGKTRDMQIGDITRELKAIAKEEDICIILFSHINRGVEKTNDKRPNLSDLRESGNIENDADAVLFLLRPEYYFKKDSRGRTVFETADEEYFKNKCQVYCDKNRDGFTFETELHCNLSTNVFSDIVSETNPF